jgi:hypothetical protein
MQGACGDQPGEMRVNRRGRGEAESLTDLTHRRWVAALGHGLLDVLQDLLLTFAEHGYSFADSFRTPRSTPLHVNLIEQEFAAKHMFVR